MKIETETRINNGKVEKDAENMMVDNAITHYSCCLSFLVFLFALSNEAVNRKKKTHHNLNAHYSSFCKNGWR